jgi:hypothetical protein
MNTVFITCHYIYISSQVTIIHQLLSSQQYFAQSPCCYSYVTVNYPSEGCRVLTISAIINNFEAVHSVAPALYQPYKFPRPPSFIVVNKYLKIEIIYTKCHKHLSISVCITYNARN